jgi:micrococcal nuclease
MFLFVLVVSISVLGAPLVTRWLTDESVPQLVPQNGVEWFTVDRVIDGDTIVLNTGEIVRYIGIDTPELKHPQVGKQCYGEEAKLANEVLLEGHQVRLVVDISQADRYGRLLRYLYRDDGVFINDALVRSGFAFVYPYPPDVQEQPLLAESQTEARHKGLGVWSNCVVTQTPSSGYFHTQTLASNGANKKE